MSLTSINTHSNLNNECGLPPITEEEIKEIESICLASINFDRLVVENGPKHRSRYIAVKVAELSKQFENRGGRKDAVIHHCFHQVLQTVVPRPKFIITNLDWLTAAQIIEHTPDQLFQKLFSDS